MVYNCISSEVHNSDTSVYDIFSEEEVEVLEKCAIP